MASSHILCILVIGLLLSAPVAAFSLSSCYAQVQGLVSLNRTLINDTRLFYQTPANMSNPVLTGRGCSEICGSTDNTIDTDCGPRLFQWVLPVVIIIGGIQMPPLAWWQRLWTMLHVLGDPIDSLLSMLNELHLFERSQAKARGIASTPAAQLLRDENDVGGEALRRSFALILHAITTLEPKISIEDAGDYIEGAITTAAYLANTFAVPRPLEELKALILKTSTTIVQIRTRSVLKPYNSIFWFVLGIVVAIIPEVAHSVPSGAMIASILILSPLLVIVFLSNAIGEYSTQPLLLRTVRDLLDGLLKQRLEHSVEGDGQDRKMDEQIRNMKLKLSSPNFPQDLLYVSGVSLYQPQKFSRCAIQGPLWKARPRIRRLGSYFQLFALLLIFPLAIASAGVAIGTSPTYFNDRHFVLLVIFISWILSAWLTSIVTMRYEGWEGTDHTESMRWVWLMIATKDVFVAIVVPVCLAAMTCGWLGGCKMWSGYYRYGPQNARVPLNPQDAFHRNGYVLYPILASLCLGLNILAFVAVRYVYKQAFAVLMWSDTEKRQVVGAEWSSNYVG